MQWHEWLTKVGSFLSNFNSKLRRGRPSKSGFQTQRGACRVSQSNWNNEPFTFVQFLSSNFNELLNLAAIENSLSWTHGNYLSHISQPHFSSRYPRQSLKGLSLRNQDFLILFLHVVSQKSSYRGTTPSIFSTRSWLIRCRVSRVVWRRTYTTADGFERLPICHSSRSDWQRETTLGCDIWSRLDRRPQERGVSGYNEEQKREGDKRYL